MFTGMYANITHPASCPEVSPVDCGEAPIVDHYHAQSLGWVRGGPTLNLGIGKGIQLVARIPVDLKVANVEYLLEDGESFLRHHMRGFTIVMKCYLGPSTAS